MAYLSPQLNENQYDYQAPADLKELAIIDIRRVEGRQEKDKFKVVTSEYFDRWKGYNKNVSYYSQLGINAGGAQEAFDALGNITTHPEVPGHQ